MKPSTCVMCGLIAAAIAAVPASASAHFKLLEPGSWLFEDNRGDPQWAGLWFAKSLSAHRRRYERQLRSIGNGHCRRALNPISNSDRLSKRSSRRGRLASRQASVVPYAA